MSFTAEDLLALRPNLTKVLVPEWGESVWIRPLTEMERGRFMDLSTQHENSSQTDKIRLVTFPVLLWSVCNEDGTPFFRDAKQITEIASKSPSSAFLRLQQRVFEICAFTAEAREALEKNFLTTRSEEPNSGSLKLSDVQ
jgi:hypothetical protein